ncbi:hypothetical protein U7230_07085 [Carboxydochorda subterranea]|uniref:HTH cro/C1-type domain-containing protein n=1 Tax=Carboxydichorda subterranea TaxID=3109565 RepID=A0ABZ1C1D6_9FIRM|nr:hypothetical protein [Limnochorda sp. L945t]WRP18749.1 hypothetical protein U7230_07085 [Limnochorda sp. L945t]
MELAGRVRVQRSLVYRWRRGSGAPPPPTTAERLALALVVRSEELRGRSIRQAAWLDEPAKELLACLVAQTAALRTG